MRFTRLLLGPYFASVVLADVDWDSAEAVHGFLTRAKASDKAECSLAENMESELSTGMRGTSFSQGARIVVSTSEGDMLGSLDRSGISSWLEMKFPDLFARSVKLAHHKNPACLDSIIFYRVGDSSHTLAGLGKNARDIVEAVPKFLRLIESFHSVGLMVPWDELQIALSVARPPLAFHGCLW